MTARLVVRADTSTGVGLGHLGRTLAIAERWIECGGEVRLLVDAVSTTGDEYLDARVRSLAAASGIEPEPVPVGTPVAEIVASMRAWAPGWIVLDGYRFGAEHQAAWNELGQLLVIDDHGTTGCFQADLLLDQNIATSGRPTPTVEMLEGPEYGLLRRSQRRRTERPDGAVDTLVVLAGGSPAAEVTTMLEELLRGLSTSVPVRVVGFEPVDVPERVEVVPFAPELGAVFADAAVVVSPSGSTGWQLAALGIPAVLFAVADNQIPVGEALAEAGAAVFVPTESGAIGSAAEQLWADSTARAAMATAGRALVPGNGAARVVAELRARSLVLRPVELADAELLFGWANDPVVRSAAFSTEPIEWDTHVAWFEQRLGQPEIWHWIVATAEAPDAPIGQVRFDRRSDDAAGGACVEISVGLAEAGRGRSLAAPTIVAGGRAVRTAAGIDAIHAQVKGENTASLRAFATAGYRVLGYRHSPAGTGELGVVESDADAIAQLVSLAFG